ncbi:hypothetical protein [Flammeovirga sp. OC4]|uniref:hypothetical protein n=1 Tax=Flammeovirga sp. OC4 TaxID=1382345 RepID=UPI0005C4C57C|nr:hypothetical protein [Flammeovirga sp. OC4]
MKVLLLITYFTIGISLLTVAQDETPASPAYEGKMAIGIYGGTTGAGIDIARNYSKFNFAFGFNYLKVSDLEQRVTVQGELMDTKLSMASISLDLRAEYLPFNKSSFKLFAGVAYIPENQIEVKGKYAKPITIGEIEFTTDDIGEIYFNGQWAKFAPYFGLGFGRAVPKRKIGFGFDLGAYYMGSPDVTFSGTEMFSQLESQQEQLRKNLEGYSWLPIMKLRLSYRIN